MSVVKSQICNYIKDNKTLRELDFFTAYMTIVELIKDGKLEILENV